MLFSTRVIPRKIITRFILHLKNQIKAKVLVSYYPFTLCNYKLVTENISISVYQGEFKVDFVLRCKQSINTCQKLSKNCPKKCINERSPHFSISPLNDKMVINF